MEGGRPKTETQRIIFSFKHVILFAIIIFTMSCEHAWCIEQNMCDITPGVFLPELI